MEDHGGTEGELGEVVAAVLRDAAVWVVPPGDLEERVMRAVAAEDARPEPTTDRADAS
ncbi:hypothetical protein ACGFIY_33535 [Micromonospora chersina]|uniref:hypothetical protein n=1 Tax=Micromonospora chersina TaxID=47854 RepID=UPI00371F6D70